MAPRRPRIDIRQASRRILFVLALCLAGNAVVYAMIVRPKIEEYRGLREANVPKFERLSERAKQVTEVEAFRKALVKAQADLKRLREDVLASRQARMVDVELELARLASQFGIDLESVAFENDRLPDEELDRFSMDVPLVGSYGSLRRFLQAVEDSDKFLVVERVGLGQTKEGGQQLQLHILLATYFNDPVAPRVDRRAESRAAREGA